MMTSPNAEDVFSYQDGILYAESVALNQLAATIGTPCFVYSRQVLEQRWLEFDNALQGMPHLVCYAVKANSNLAVLNLLARLGSGFDIVSGGELTRVLRAGGQASKIVFSGVGKSVEEIRYALSEGIHCFNVESEAELLRINQVASELNLKAPISLRVNPDVDAGTHPYISTGLKQNKFGVAIEQALALYQKAHALPHLNVIGIDCHIGSQLTDTTPFADALDRVLALLERLQQHGIQLQHIDFGGGLGVCYKAETPPAIADYVAILRQRLEGLPYSLLLEPGRAIAAPAGVLLTQVEHLKHTDDKQFAIVDAAMNDLIRPALYGAWQDIVPVQPRSEGEAITYDVVGPICETGDFLGKDRALNVQEGDLLAVRSAGAYGFVMSSNYNTRCRAAEIIVDGAQWHVVRRRETLEDLLSLEQVLAV